MRARPIHLAALVLVVTSSVVGAQSRGGDRVSGRWSLAVKTAEGPDTRALDLVMAPDSSITGTITSSLGRIPITAGRLERDRVRFEFATAGGEIRVSYDLLLRGDTLRGTFRQGDYEGDVLGIRGERAVRLPDAEGPTEYGAVDRNHYTRTNDNTRTSYTRTNAWVIQPRPDPLRARSR